MNTFILIRNRSHALVLLLGINLLSMALCSFATTMAIVPLPDRVKGKAVVVFGELTGVAEDPSTANGDGPKHSLFVGKIKVEKVLKNATKEDIQVGSEIPLGMQTHADAPPVAGMFTIGGSTPQIFQNGTKGFWLLDFKDGKYWAPWMHLDFQPATQEKEVLGALGTEKNLNQKAVEMKMPEPPIGGKNKKGEVQPFMTKDGLITEPQRRGAKEEANPNPGLKKAIMLTPACELPYEKGGAPEK